MKKNHEIRVKVTEEELAKIQSKAQELGMTSSSYLRTMGLIASFSAETPTKLRPRI